MLPALSVTRYLTSLPPKLVTNKEPVITADPENGNPTPPPDPEI